MTNVENLVEQKIVQILREEHALTGYAIKENMESHKKSIGFNEVKIDNQAVYFEQFSSFFTYQIV